MSLISRIFGFLKPAPSNAVVLSPADFKKGIAQKHRYLLDVRTPGEFSSGSIDNARNLNILNKSQFTAEANKMDKQKPIYLFCRSGSRSRTASRVLTELGFEKIYDLSGGYMNWR